MFFLHILGVLHVLINMMKWIIENTSYTYHRGTYHFKTLNSKIDLKSTTKLVPVVQRGLTDKNLFHSIVLMTAIVYKNTFTPKNSITVSSHLYI